MHHLNSFPIFAQADAPPIPLPPAPRSWSELQHAEPRLRRLAKAVAAGCYGRDWEAVKAAIKPLVGWYARRPELGSESLYEIASRELNRLLARRRRAGAR